MDYLTVLFLNQLAGQVERADELLKLVRKELLAEFERQMSCNMVSGVLFYTGRARALQQRCAQWLESARQLPQIGAGKALLRELETLAKESDFLRQETRNQLQSPASIDMDRMHIIDPQDHEQTLRLIEEMIRFDLYRVAAIGGGALLTRITPFRRVSATLEAYMDYYRQEVLGALNMCSETRKYAFWAVQHRGDGKCGAYAKLPAYVIAEPKKVKHPMLPGEYQIIEDRGGILMQGVGMLTNVTPNNILSAQDAGVGYKPTVRQILQCGADLSRPDQVLAGSFEGGYYAVDPFEFFGMLSAAEDARVILRRGQLQQCFLCAAPVQNNAPLCPACMKRVQIQ